MGSFLRGTTKRRGSTSSILTAEEEWSHDVAWMMLSVKRSTATEGEGFEWPYRQGQRLGSIWMRQGKKGERWIRIDTVTLWKKSGFLSSYGPTRGRKLGNSARVESDPVEGGRKKIYRGRVLHSRFKTTQEHPGRRMQGLFQAA